MVNEYKHKIAVLEHLKSECVDAEIKIVGRQDDDLLIELLNEEYPKLFSAVKNQILSLLDGKKALTKVSDTEKIKLENKLKGNCFLNDITPIDKTGKLLPFNKIVAKISKEINILNKRSNQYIKNLLDIEE